MNPHVRMCALPKMSPMVYLNDWMDRFVLKIGNMQTCHLNTRNNTHALYRQK